MRLLKKFTIANSLVAMLLLSAFALLSFDRFHAEAVRETSANLERCMRTFGELLRQKGMDFNIADGKLLAGGYVINGNFEVPDKVQEIFGGTATVFMGDKRVSTNVLKEDGTRAVGTRLEGPVYDAIFKQGKPYRGEARILGIPYFTAYDPIRDSKGKIIGALYVGMKKSELVAHYTMLKTQIALILLGLLAIFTTFMILFNRLAKKADMTRVLDITERKRVEEELRESQRYLSDIIQFFPDATMVIDLAGKVVAWNHAMEEMSGVKAEEMLGKGEYEYALPFYGERRPILIDLVIQPAPEIERKYPRTEWQGNTLVGEAYVRNRRGEELYFHGTAAPLCNSRGEIIGAIESIRDITERKRAEDEIRRLNAELEVKVEERTSELLEAQEDLVRKEKLAILGRLSGCVGHELRNPLGVMSNAVYFLQMVLADADDTTKEYLEMIKHEIDNSQRIIADLLDFARTKTPQTKAVTVRELVTESLGRCVIPPSVELRTELPETLPLLKVDPLQIGQVLQNLITNAFQSMPDGGALRVAARRVTSFELRVLSSESDSKFKIQNSKLDGDFIEISVADTGEGISPEGMKRLFQPLFTTKARGIGLGLTVCRNLTEANGGRIEVESRLGEGTTFTVILPVGGE